MKKNRGMFLETLINRSNDYIWKNKIGFVEKRFTKIHISKITGNKVSGFLASKNYVDYRGFVNNKAFEFEAKSTILNKFYFKNIKENQLRFLIEIKKMNVESFFIICFQRHKTIIKIDIDEINKLILNGKKAIDINEAVKKGKELKVLYPGIINYWDN